MQDTGEKCRFRDALEAEERLIEQQIIGIRHTKTQEKLLSRDDMLTLDAAMDIARTHESTLADMNAFQTETSSLTTHQVKQRGEDGKQRERRRGNCTNSNTVLANVRQQIQGVVHAPEMVTGRHHAVANRQTMVVSQVLRSPGDPSYNPGQGDEATRALLRLERTMNLLEGGKGGEGRMGERGWGGDGGRVGREGGEGTWGREGGWGDREGEGSGGRGGEGGEGWGGRYGRGGEGRGGEGRGGEGRGGEGRGGRGGEERGGEGRRGGEEGGEERGGEERRRGEERRGEERRGEGRGGEG